MRSYTKREFIAEEHLAEMNSRRYKKARAWLAKAGYTYHPAHCTYQRMPKQPALDVFVDGVLVGRVLNLSLPPGYACN